MEGQAMLGYHALDAIVIQCNYRFGAGWDVMLHARANGQAWEDTRRRLYSYLTTEELAQVISDEMGRLCS